MSKLKTQREDLYNRMHAGVSVHAKRLFPGQTWESLMMPELFDALHECRLWDEIYAAGFNDDHISAALRKIHAFGPL